MSDTPTRASCLISELRGYGANRIVFNVDHIGRIRASAAHNMRRHKGDAETIFVDSFQEHVEDALSLLCIEASGRGWKDGQY